MPPRAALLPVIALSLVLIFSSLAPGQSPPGVVLPVTLDYPFLTSLLIYQKYNRSRPAGGDAGRRPTAPGVEMWEPRLDRQGQLLRLRTQIKIKAGVVIPFFYACVDPVDWQGQLEVLQGGEPGPGRPPPQGDHQGVPPPGPPGRVSARWPI